MTDKSNDKCREKAPTTSKRLISLFMQKCVLEEKKQVSGKISDDKHLSDLESWQL